MKAHLHLKKYISKKDIVLYKVVKIAASKGSPVLCTLDNFTIIKFNELFFDQQPEKFVLENSKVYADIGIIHLYRYLEDAIDACSDDAGLIIVQAIIPAGFYYYKGTYKNRKVYASKAVIYTPLDEFSNKLMFQLHEREN